MIDNDILTASEIVNICNTYPNAKVSFESKISGGLLGGSYTNLTFIRGYKIMKNSDNEVTDIIFVEDAVIPRNAPIKNIKNKI